MNSTEKAIKARALILIIDNVCVFIIYKILMF